MMQVIEAIYSGGVLKPVEKLTLPETQRVRLIVQPLNEQGDTSRSAALQRLLVGIESMQFFSSGHLPTREELHDRS
jgi:predicted DNA-binding antitoxin AbrB/MazE fold protein